MFQLPTSPPFLKVFWFMLLSSVLIAQCTSDKSIQLPEQHYLGGRILMQTPYAWHQKPMQSFWRHDPRDTVFTTLIGAGLSEAQIRLRQQVHMNVSDVSFSIIRDIYALSDSYAKILSVKTDSIQNKIVVEYLLRQKEKGPLLYSHDLTIIKGRKWAHVVFHGPNTQACRDTIQQMAASIRILGK